MEVSATFILQCITVLSVFVFATIGSWSRFVARSNNDDYMNIRSRDNNGKVKNNNNELLSLLRTTAIDEESKHCLSIDALTNFFSDKEQVFIFMAAKAGGSSVKQFANTCSGMYQHHPDNFIMQKENRKPFLIQTLQTPSVIASHILSSEPLRHYMHFATRKAVAVYIYREETDRLYSAINTVVKDYICKGLVVLGNEQGVDTYMIDNRSKNCTLKESFLVDKIIEKEAQEIGFSNPKNLDCDFWDSLNDDRPDLLFVHYSKVSPLQQAIANRFCPNTEPAVVNVLGEKELTEKNINVQLSNSNQIVPFNEWLTAKLHSLQFTLQIGKGSCKGKIKAMEKHLMSCDDKVLYLSHMDR